MPTIIACLIWFTAGIVFGYFLTYNLINCKKNENKNKITQKSRI